MNTSGKPYLLRHRNRKQERVPNPQLAHKKLLIRAFHLGLVSVRLLLSPPLILLIDYSHPGSPFPMDFEPRIEKESRSTFFMCYLGIIFLDLI